MPKQAWFRVFMIANISSIPRCGFCYSDKVSTAEEIDELRQAGAALLEKNVKLDIQQHLEKCNKGFKVTRGGVQCFLLTW
jgi:hypothetical protein